MDISHLRVYRIMRKIYNRPVIIEEYRTQQRGLVPQYPFFLFLYALLCAYKASLLCSIDGAASPVIGVYHVPHNKKQVDFIKAILFPELQEIGFAGGRKRSWFDPVALSALKPFLSVRLLERLLSLYKNRDNHLMAHYLVAFIFYQRYFDRLVPMRVAKLGVVANDHSPMPLAFTTLCRKYGVKTLYIQHAQVSPLFPPLSDDFVILDNLVSLGIYKEIGIKTKHIFMIGIEGRERAIRLPKKIETVGLFVSVYDFMNRRSDIEQLAQRYKVLLRYHPSMTKRPPLPASVEVSPGGSIYADLDRCDVVIGGNSSFFVEALKYGVPGIYYDPIDPFPHDYYGFVKGGIVFEATTLDDLDFSAMLNFYEQTSWIENFKHYDPYYFNTDARVAAIRDMKDKICHEIDYRSL